MKYIRVLLLTLLSLILTTTPIHASNLESITVESRYMSVVEINPRTTVTHYQKNGDAKMYPASMTKIMSVYVAFQHLNDLDIQVTLLPEDFAGLNEANASMAGFLVGETVTIKDLLYGSLLSSGAEATRTLARLVSTNEASFVDLMNQTAKNLQMNDTHFVNTSGLHDDKHYSTVNDLIKLMVAALSHPQLKEMMSALNYRTSPSNGHANGLLLSNTLNAYSEIGGHDIGYIQGGKTGWTPQAGYCLLSFSDYHDKTIIIASGDAFDYGIQLKDHNELYEILFDQKHTLNVFNKNQEIGSVRLEFAQDSNSFPLLLPEEVILEVPTVVTLDDLTIDVKQINSIQAPVKSQTEMATINIKYDDQLLFDETIKSQEDIKRDDIAYHTHLFITWITTPLVIRVILGIFLAIILLIIVIRFIVKKKRDKERYRFRRSKNQWRL